MSNHQNSSIMFLLFCGVIVLPFINTLPVDVKDDPFDKFIDFLLTNNCSMPSAVTLPFSVPDSSSFSYLSTPLKECQSSDAVKPNKEANLLCKEVFDVLQNITCYEYKVTSKIDSSHLSDDICLDFAAKQNIIPKQAEYLSTKLGDSMICHVLCSDKYQLLCKTLLWSYDTQEKLKNAASHPLTAEKENLSDLPLNGDASPPLSAEQENVKNDALNGDASAALSAEKKDVNKLAVSGDSVPPVTSQDGKANNLDVNGGIVATSVENNEISEEKPNSNLEEDLKKPFNESNLNNSDSKLTVTKNSTVLMVTSSSSLPDLKEEKTILTDTSKNTNSDKILNHSNDPSQDVIKNLPTDQDLNGLGNTAPKENQIRDETKNVENPPVDANQKVKGKTLPNESGNGQSKEPSFSSHTLPDHENKIDAKEKTKQAEETDLPKHPKPETNNEFAKEYQDQENEIETEKKPTDLNSKSGNSQENVISDVEPKTDKGMLEPTLFPDKNEDAEQHSEVKDPDQYNNGFSPSLKKDSDIKHALDDSSSRISSSSNMQIGPDELGSQGLDIRRNYLPGGNYLPDQEDSHFFFYFLSIVLILMAGYLIFHNKQKIIALIVEGRHERRRRSHGAGYKKLETK